MASGQVQAFDPSLILLGAGGVDLGLAAGRDSAVLVPGCGGFGLLTGLGFFECGVALDLVAECGVRFLATGAGLALTAGGGCGFLKAAGAFPVDEVRACRPGEVAR